ncbi:MAG: hypothetical protein KatS3mg102_0450 [Planctomycetota bacterium]|nr:MAG: hypothetical protein KatS3mg102_0450 [Planctomycetota bacterium]
MERNSAPLPPVLAEWAERIRGYAREYGLDFYDVIFELVDYDELNQVACYGGFPTRYPHWRFGMEYEQLAKGYSYGLHKIYELVINNNPCVAYLLRSNSLVDQKLVMAHVYGHADFFKNNEWFRHTNRKMLDEMANHATRVRRYMEQYGHERVERFIDDCLTLENLIDIHAPFIKRRRTRPRSELAEEEPPRTIRRFQAKDYMDRYLNPPEFLEEQRRALEQELERQRRFPEEPERDVLLFLLEHAPLERWQRDVLDMVREEAYYFAPQAMTKILNEGWACLAAGALVYTDAGLVPIEELVARGQGTVWDGARPQRVYDRHRLAERETVTVRTRGGLRLCGAAEHRVLLADGMSWRRLDELRPGDRLCVSGGGELWARQPVEIAWRPSGRALAYTQGPAAAGLVAPRGLPRRRASGALGLVPQAAMRLPRRLEPPLGELLGYLAGAGRLGRRIVVRVADEELAVRFAELCEQLFGLPPRLRWDGRRWRAALRAEPLAAFLAEGLGLASAPGAHRQGVPAPILRSPEPVVRAFLRACFDAAAHPGARGVVLRTASEPLSEQLQLLLLNYGILARRRRRRSGRWELRAAGAAAARFAERIGFGLGRKQRALEARLEGLRACTPERWEDEVVALERGRAEVYDISVTGSHRYAAAGLIHHNSYWHSTIMTQKALEDSELIDYAEVHAGTMGSRPGVLNPYKIGLELLRDIEERWNKGRFGKEWEECDDLDRKRAWDTGLGKGREKIFAVRRIYNDVMFIDEFLTPEFCEEHRLFTYEYDSQSGEYVIASRDFKAIKEKLLRQLTNFGQPVIYVENANYHNRGELYLRHAYDGLELKLDDARETLASLYRIWTRPVHVETVIDRRRKLLSFDGSRHGETTLG